MRPHQGHQTRSLDYTQRISSIFPGRRTQKVLILLCAIKERNKPLCLTHISDFCPLALRGIKTGGVVRACLKDNYISLFSFVLQFVDHPRKVERPRLRVVVWVELPLDGRTRTFPYYRVVDPGRVRNPDRPGLDGVDKEDSSNMRCPSA